jgi:hypothetical protein
MGYFDLQAVSNSDLKSLKTLYNGAHDYLSEMTHALTFGSLVDALLIEAWRVNFLEKSLHDEKGQTIFYSDEIFNKAVRLAQKAKEDPVISKLIPLMAGQYIFVRTLKFMYEDSEYEIKAKCKFDGIVKKIKTGLDYKALACATNKAFIESVDYFDYDQQAAWYMDLAKIDYHWIMCLSKSTDKIFKLAIQRGDPIYLRGKKKYEHWAYKWVTLIDGFNL